MGRCGVRRAGNGRLLTCHLIRLADEMASVFMGPGARLDMYTKAWPDNTRRVRRHEGGRSSVSGVRAICIWGHGPGLI